MTVFDFAEILSRTEKRVHDDLLGSGPKSVDELRAIHSRNFTKYMKALERKEQLAQRQYDRVLKRSQTSLSNVTNQPQKYPDEEIEEILLAIEGAKKATVNMTGNVMNKFKQFGYGNGMKEQQEGESNKNEITTEEVDFAMPPKNEEEKSKSKPSSDLFDMSDAPPPPVIEKTAEVSVDELFDFDTNDISPTNFTIDDDDFL